MISGPCPSRKAFVEYVVSSEGPYKSYTFSTVPAFSISLTNWGLRGSPAKFTVRTDAGRGVPLNHPAMPEGTVLIKVTASAFCNSAKSRTF